MTEKEKTIQKHFIKNNALNRSVEWIKNNPYTKEILSVSEIELINSTKRISVSEIQGDYPVNVKFTPMQKIEVTYKNKYYGIMKAIIQAGFDAVRYTSCCATSCFDGKYLSKDIISVDFVGEYSTATNTIVENGAKNKEVLL